MTYHSRFRNAIRAVQLARIDGQRASRRSLSRHSLTRRSCRNDRILGFSSARVYTYWLSVRDYIPIYSSSKFSFLRLSPRSTCRSVPPLCVPQLGRKLNSLCASSARARITRLISRGRSAARRASALQNVVYIVVRGIQTQPSRLCAFNGAVTSRNINAHATSLASARKQLFWSFQRRRSGRSRDRAIHPPSRPIFTFLMVQNDGGIGNRSPYDEGIFVKWCGFVGGLRRVIMTVL